MKKIAGNTPHADAVPAGFQEELWRYSLEGFQFDQRAHRWQLNASQAILVKELRELCWSKVLEESLIATLAHVVETFSAGTVKSIKVAMKHLLCFTPEHLRSDQFSSELLLSFRDFARLRFGNDCLVSRAVRPFFRRWLALGHPGVPVEVVEMLNRWRLKGAERNVAVNRLDANRGPLMPDEHVAFAAKLLNAFEVNAISLDDYLLVRLLEVTGRRPAQITQLKFKDLENSRFEDCLPGEIPARLRLLRIPRVKNAGAVVRRTFRSVAVTEELWALLTLQRKTVLGRVDRILESIGFSLQPQDLAWVRDEIPLIPEWSAIEARAEDLHALVICEQHGEAISALRTLVQGQHFHRPPAYTVSTLRKVVCTIRPISKDGGQLDVTARRFRYTKEFDLERAGCASPIIAWNMDHSSVESLAAYSKNGPDRARTISQAMALQLSPFVDVFQGKLVDAESLAEGGEDPAASRILVDGITPGATCATKRGCGMSGLPRPCYDGCPHFRPWVDGPHLEYLETILAERERDMKSLRPVEDRAVIEAADSLIINIVQVIRLCHRRREEVARADDSNVQN